MAGVNRRTDAMAQSLDTFAQIAAHGATRAAGLVELPAVAKADRILPGRGPRSWRPSRELRSAADLAAELARLRRRYARFQRDLAPQLSESRPRVDIAAMDWRLAADPDHPDQAAALAGSGAWSRVAIPHYGGPVGRAVAWYRCSFTATRALLAKPHQRLCFRGVDYRASVWLNGIHLGSHEGFFAPFSCDATQAVRRGINTIVVRVENDGVGNGGSPHNPPGEKIYAATGPGWDEAGSGWHHCPPGMGIYQPLWVEGHEELWIEDLWVRPIPERGIAEAWVEIHGMRPAWSRPRLELAVHGLNFRGTPFSARELPLPWETWRGTNLYRFELPLPAHRSWEPEAPWLYRLQARLLETTGRELDVRGRAFGMRSFVIDETGERKGRILLNGREIRLRGANTMGHEQQCVMRGDLAQLREDILIAKAANLNFLRLTQRPVQSEVYEACDRLGMMLQSDLPLFGVLPRAQGVEALRQVREMVRLVRPHASSVLVSWINEPFPAAWGNKLSRAMTRPELETWFVSAANVARLEHPDLAIKPVDGDYDPPTGGLPDGHAYPMWYNGHGIDAGRMHAGKWMAFKPGWYVGCGEYGAEGLDTTELMRRRYPKAWLPSSPADEAAWTPARICQAQTGTFQYMFFDQPKTLEEWSTASQAYQVWATRVMSEALRRNPYIVSTAVHLLIDAWPAGWMKSLVDCARRPKPAYFALREAFAPVRPLLRSDRSSWWSGESIEVETWLCNDRSVALRGELRWRVELAGRVLAGGAMAVRVGACTVTAPGRIRCTLPQVQRRTPLRIALALVDGQGRTVAEHALEHEAWPRDDHGGTAVIIGRRGGPAERLAVELGLHPVRRLIAGRSLVLVDDAATWAGHAELLEAAVRRGAHALILASTPGAYRIAGDEVSVHEHHMGRLHFVSRATGHPLVAGLRAADVRWWHDADAGIVTPLCHAVATAPPGWKEVLTSGNCGWGVPRSPAAACLERQFGSGRIVFNQVLLSGRTKTNPAAQLLALRLAGLAVVGPDPQPT